MSNLQKVINFLMEIGLETKQGEIPKSFLPNVTIKDGVLFYNENTAVSDLLHEAGHLAIMPKKYRSMCQADMGKNQRKIWQIAEECGETKIDSPIYRALIQADECEATAWAWAAGKHLGIADEEIILNNDYQGGGEDLRFNLNAKCYFGINGLRAAGMLESVKKYPHITRWTQP